MAMEGGTRKEEHRRTSRQLLTSQPCLDYQLIERGLDIIKKSLAIPIRTTEILVIIL